MCRVTATPCASTLVPSTPHGPSRLETRNGQTKVPSGHTCMRQHETLLRTSYRDLFVVSLNLWGAKESYDPDRTTRDYSKLETLTCQMTTNHIDIYLLQETWLIGDWTTTIANITMVPINPQVIVAREV